MKTNHDAIEVVVWGLGLLGLWVASLQLRESRNQRSVSETFELFQKLDEALATWHHTATQRDVSEQVRRSRLAGLLSIYELICDAINRRMVTRMSQIILTNQIIDSISSVYAYAETKSTHEWLCSDPKVCSAVKWFLLDNWRKWQSDERLRAVATAFLTTSDLATAGLSPRNIVARRLRILKFRLAGS